MTNVPHEKARRHLLDAAVLLAPTDVEQAGFIKVNNDAAEAGETPHAITRTLVAALDTALRVGNWPTPCPDCNEWLAFRGHFAAPGHGQSWECKTEHSWVKIGASWHRPEEHAHILRPEDVR